MASAAERLMDHIRNLADPAQRMSGTDGQLLARWLTGHDDRAFAALVARHGALVWRVGRNVLHQREDAEDVFQATFMVLARKAASLQKQSSVAGWLYQTAYHLALKARTEAIGRARRDRQARQQMAAQPLEELSVREARLILGEELNRLPAAYREILLLCLYEGATQNEAARQLGCSLNTVKRRLERGRALLGRRLTRRGLAPTIALALTLCSRSEIPAQLARLTIAAATHFAARQALTGSAVVLATGVLRTLVLKKVAIYITFLLALSGMTVVGGFALTREKPTSVASGPPLPQLRAAQRALKKEPELRLDVNGDPLPPGAVSRIGSNRFRHNGRVERVLYTPDGKAIASTSYVMNRDRDGYLNLWDKAAGKLRWRVGMNKINYFSELAISADGKKLAVLSDFEYAVVATDTGKKLVKHVRMADDERARCLAIAPNMRTFARGCFDATVRLYDAVDGQEKVRIVVGDKAQRQFPLAISFSAGGEMIYVLVPDQVQPGILVFDTKSGKAGQTLRMQKALANPCYLIASQNRHLLAALDRDQVVLWDLKSGKQQYRVENELPAACGTFSPDESLLALSAISAPADIVMLDTATGKEQHRFPTHPGTISLVFAPDGKTLAAADYGGCITLFDASTGKPMSPAPDPTGLVRNRFHVRFTNDGMQILCFGDSVDWWDLASAKPTRRLVWNRKWFNGDNAQSMSPDGKLLAAFTWSYSNVPGELVLMEAATGKQLRVLAGHKPTVTTTAFSPDGTKLFSAGLEDHRIIIWDVATGKPLHTLQATNTEYDHTLTVSPNGRWLAFAATGARAQKDYDIRLWDVATGKLVHRLTPRRGSVFSMVFSADSTRLVSVGGEPGRRNEFGEVQLWDVASGEEVRAFTGHKERVTCVAITADGRMLATGSLDNTLRLWEISSGKERTRIPGHEAPVFSLDFSRNGRLLAAASMDAPVYIWDAYAPPNLKLTSGKLLKQDREKLWHALADTDAAVGFQAICELIAHPSEAPAILEGGWKQLPRATPKQMRAWVADLSSAQFTVRKTATSELERFAAAHESLLRDALKQAGSLEARQRLEKILGRINPEGLRRSRMLEVLEQLHTAPARRFLQTLTDQTEDVVMALEAAAGLKRLDQQAKGTDGANLRSSGMD